MTTNASTRGEVWLVRMPQAVGVELQRDRPAVVISSSSFDEQAIRIVVPLSSWRDEFAGRLNKVVIQPDEQNGLDAVSAADFLQVRSISTQRFLRRIGTLETALVEEIVSGVAIAVDYHPQNS